MIELYPHQEEAVRRLKNGSILWGGVGTGKSLTAVAYYIRNEYPKDLLIITTARKRDTGEWEDECMKLLPPDFMSIRIDSWNNIEKYADVHGCFIIFDEQRVTGNGPWANTFVKMAKANRWILLSATPGDKWIEYMPVFIAHGFYKNKTEFRNRHVIYSQSSRIRYPKIIGYREKDILEKHRSEILVGMSFEKHTVQHHEIVTVDYDRELYLKALRDRWDPFKNEPVIDAAGLCYVLRRCANQGEDRLAQVFEIMVKHRKAIIFYNFNYELEMLRQLPFTVREWNGQKHEEIPDGDRWAYLVQYTAGAEGWNCITTDTIIFYSRNYSYKTLMQAAGRIDRLNTGYSDLYYFYLVTDSGIDKAIGKALNEKRDFNESAFAESVLG